MFRKPVRFQPVLQNDLHNAKSEKQNTISIIYRIQIAFRKEIYFFVFFVASWRPDSPDSYREHKGMNFLRSVSAIYFLRNAIVSGKPNLYTEFSSC